MNDPIPEVHWWNVGNLAEIPSPALLIFWERVQRNLAQMIAIAGDPTRLRPHIKTHKLPQLIHKQLSLGIRKFKCATIAEAEMSLEAGAQDLLLAYQPVGPNVSRFAALVAKFPTCRISCVVDNPGTVRSLSQSALEHGLSLEVFVDIDLGQHRTGIPAGPEALALYRLLNSTPGLKAAGLHAYDGHIHDSDLASRTTACNAAFASVEQLRADIVKEGMPEPVIVAGGTPTFPIHARRKGVELSPGTCVFWDAGYQKKLPDLDFLPAAVLLTRVVSLQGKHHLCLDLGHKAVASEMPHPRAVFLNLPNATATGHSEEHLVVEVPDSGRHAVGDTVFALPWHVCPTVALHSEVFVVRNQTVTETWPVKGRVRKITL